MFAWGASDYSAALREFPKPAPVIVADAFRDKPLAAPFVDGGLCYIEFGRDLGCGEHALAEKTLASA